MVTAHLLKSILALLDARKSKILTYAQVGMTENQFKAYRGLVLDELGKNGLESELDRLLNEGNHLIRIKRYSERNQTIN